MVWANSPVPEGVQKHLAVVVSRGYPLRWRIITQTRRLASDFDGVRA
jgi:hypothetical protein